MIKHAPSDDPNNEEAEDDKAQQKHAQIDKMAQNSELLNSHQEYRILQVNLEALQKMQEGGFNLNLDQSES